MKEKCFMLNRDLELEKKKKRQAFKSRDVLLHIRTDIVSL